MQHLVCGPTTMLVVDKNGSCLIVFSACSKVDKVREFIKDVYVDKKYAGGNTSDKPPRDLQVTSQ